ncbi:hypothetical protein CFP56_012710, partial [Quercus suber]
LSHHSNSIYCISPHSLFVFCICEKIPSFCAVSGYDNSVQVSRLLALWAVTFCSSYLNSIAWGGGMFSNIGSGMLGLELPVHQHQQQQKQQQQQQQNPTNTQNSHHLNHHTQMLSYPHNNDPDHHPPQQSLKFPFAQKAKQPISLSDEEDPAGFGADDNNSGDAKRKNSPWQRMKWTDTMVRLLIMAVYYIGDEAGPEGTDQNAKKKSSGLLQKKGKWKSVSRAMMEKGFYVSPQQCEDKFNDLNKRYKRVNDILGKGTACRVVENQSLLETMDLTPKMKEEVRKLLNSKHLFFREMCAYHNSCGHGVVNQSAEVATEPSNSHVQNQQAQQQRCFHSSENAGVFSNGSAQLMQQLRCELVSMVQDGAKSPWDKKQWMRTRLMQLEEQQVMYQCQAFELEKQRLKWVKFSSKKEREMDRAKLENERRRLQNERMVLLVRQKEIELLDLQHQHHHQQQHSSNKRGDPSSITG